MRLNNTCINFKLKKGIVQITIKKSLLHSRNYVLVIVQFAYACRRSSRDIYLIYLMFYTRNVYLRNFKNTTTYSGKEIK